jgi:transcriptional regulator with XRE-family HTH domain
MKNGKDAAIISIQEQNMIGRRLSEARNRMGLTLQQLSDRLALQGIEIGRAGISRWECGDRQPNASQFLGVCRVLGIENIGAFFGLEPLQPELNEQGMKKLREYKEDLIASGRYAPKHKSENIRYISMPVSMLPASAGTGAFLDEGCFEMVEVPENSVPHGAEFGVRISGDSMEPVYHDGEIIWIKPCEMLRPGQVGLFMYDGNGYVKEYDEQMPAAEEAETYLGSDQTLRMQPVLKSFNRAYAPIRVSPDAAFSIAGRVLN